MSRRLPRMVWNPKLQGWMPDDDSFIDAKTGDVVEITRSAKWLSFLVLLLVLALTLTWSSGTRSRSVEQEQE